MPNRTERARHLTLVPDIETESDPVAGRFQDAPGDIPVVQLILYVDVIGMNPPVWRKIKVRSDLLLPEFHAVLQAAIGWGGGTEYKMSGSAGTGSQDYCTPLLLEETEHCPSGDYVRIDSILLGPRDHVRYQYGKRWIHSIDVMSVDFDIDDLRPVCLAGSGMCPPDEGYSVTDARLAQDAEPTAMTVEAANRRLRDSWCLRSPETESSAASPLVARIFRRARSAPVPRLLDLLPRCELTIESSVDLPVAQIAMEKISWFLRCVGDRGIPLTYDGRLPEAVVEMVREQLDWGIGWVGDSAREFDHHQATDLREAAKALGLVRVLKGTLVRTKAGALLVDDHIGLWHHCAARLPLGRQDHEQDAGILFLVALAASASAVQRDDMVVETMHALEWGVNALDAFEAQKAAHPTVAFLDLIGAHGPLFYLGSGGTDSPSWARRFARDALRTGRRL
ncbi:hypothetical protein QMK17_23630 [Rhodococcus sp. G-MC3]|uniref:IS1096 element passenger TnpR family protein n=1 Tax=Rhodococcus sp. G-MC3 TaxID=3046209 RepID=UPI0024B94B2D|nr:hypothetical protein [Rhodococcus sp. G-MC3]MDJ0396299.1 hypothetical protein [Rhodococcus sp. G-MC3]